MYICSGSNFGVRILLNLNSSFWHSHQTLAFPFPPFYSSDFPFSLQGFFFLLKCRGKEYQDSTMSFSASRAFVRALMAAAKTSVADAPSATTKAAATSATKPRGGITFPKPVSPTLAEFLGTNEASRAEAVKKVWDYVKSKGLQVAFSPPEYVL